MGKIKVFLLVKGGKEFLTLKIADKGAGRYLGVCSTFRRWYSIRRQGGAYKGNLQRNEEHFASRLLVLSYILKGVCPKYMVI